MSDIEQVIKKEELDGLFYKAICRRPLIDVVQEVEEQQHWAKTFNSSNGITLYSWRNDWLANLKANLEHFKYFDRDHSVKCMLGELRDRACIIVGAGPSLQHNIEYLKLAKERGVKIIASHHALMYMARPEYMIKPDYVVCLDAGKIWTDYFSFGSMDMSDVPLIVDYTCYSEHLKKWQGPVFFYKSAQPDNIDIGKFLKMELERFVPEERNPSILEVGGHVIGSCFAFAQSIGNSPTIIFAGVDYCFGAQDGKFYPFDHKCDQTVVTENHDGTFSEKPAPPQAQGRIVDIFGNMVYTTNNYLGFKNVMDLGIKNYKVHAMANNLPVDFINGSEGGCLGSLEGGLSKFMQYMRLEDAIHYGANKYHVMQVQKNKQKEAK